MIMNKLKSIRHEHEMNQIQFADLLGVGRSLYNRWENQKVQPELETVLRIAKKLQRPVEQIVYLVEGVNS